MAADFEGGAGAARRRADPALADYLAKTATYDVCAETAAERAQRYGAVPALLILRAVCAAYGVTPLDLASRRRTVAIIAPLHEAA